jgi:hypothetical protein
LASQQQFEGPVLEDLLERVRAEVGPSARIVAANRVRKGGVGGFFARQAFEVLVEPANATPEEPRQPIPAPAAAPTVSTSTAPAATAPVAAAQPRAETHAPATILELADAVSEHERTNIIDLVEEHHMSTESRDFARVLDRFSQTIDATPDELTATSDELNAVTAAPARFDTAPPARDAIAGDIDLRESGPIPGAPPVEASPLPPMPPAPAPQPFAHEPVEPTRRASVDELALGARAGRTTGDPASEARSRRGTAPPKVIDRYETRLSNMGLPARLIPRGVSPHELKGALVESLTRLPAAPSVPQGLGVVIAIVGAGSAPVLHARELASDLGLDPDDVVLATRERLVGGIPAWLQMSDAGTAQERRRSWYRRTRPTIVACSLPRVAGLRWAREILDNLEPTMTWAVVDAGAKREDIAHRVDALGGVDALTLDDIEDTVSPATALELGIPVTRLEQEHASPLTWTELLLERLSS